MLRVTRIGDGELVKAYPAGRLDCRLINVERHSHDRQENKKGDASDNFECFFTLRGPLSGAW